MATPQAPRLPRILLVDDEKDNLQALARLLRKQFEIFTASSGEEGLEVFKRTPNFEVVVSDQRMPGLQGSEFLEQIRATDALPTRILLTGFSDLEAVVEAVNRGQIWRYISKPWEPEELKITLQQAAERCQMQKSITQYQKELERAVTELRAKDWARERLLLILLHEFRTAPQILESLRQLDGGGPDEEVRQRFIGNLDQRFRILEKDIVDLLAEERNVTALERKPVLLDQLILAIEKRIGIRPIFSNPNGTVDHFGDGREFFLHLPTVVDAFAHVADLLRKNTLAVPLRWKLDWNDGPRIDLFFSFELDGKSEWPVPESLRAQAISPQVAWKALLEPFVGTEDFSLHSSGLRLATAKTIRALAGQGFKAEFNFDPAKHVVELLLRLASA